MAEVSHAAVCQVLLALVVLCLPVQAQPREAPAQAAWVQVQDAHFRHTGDVPGFAPYTFDAPLVGIGYARTALRAEIAVGRATAPAGRVRIFDADLSTGSTVPLVQTYRYALGIPLRLAFMYRRVQRSSGGGPTDFDVTVLGLQSGITLQPAPGTTGFTAALTGGAGLATRNFDGTPGYGYHGGAEVGGNVPLRGRFWLTAGYRFRLQGWDLGSGAFTGAREGDLYDYRAFSHGLYAGLLF